LSRELLRKELLFLSQENYKDDLTPSEVYTKEEASKAVKTSESILKQIKILLQSQS